MKKEFKALPKIVRISGNGSHFSAPRHAKFHRRIYDIIKAVDKTKLKFPAGLLEEYDARSDAEVEANKQSTMSANTALMLEKDEKRDQLLIYIFGKVRNELRSPVDATSAAAHRIWAALGTYKDIRTESFDEETLHIDGMLKDIVPIAADITTLGLTSEFASLKTLNDEYESLSAQREHTTAVTKGPSSKEIRPLTDAAYEVICQYIQSAYLNATSDEDRTMLEELVAEMNRTVVKFRTSQREEAAQKRAAKQPKDPKPKDPKQPRDPKQPKDPKDPKPDKPKPDDKPDIKLPEEGPKKPDPKKPEEGGGPDIHLPEE